MTLGVAVYLTVCDKCGRFWYRGYFLACPVCGQKTSRTERRRKRSNPPTKGDGRRDPA